MLSNQMKLIGNPTLSTRNMPQMKASSTYISLIKKILMEFFH